MRTTVRTTVRTLVLALAVAAGLTPPAAAYDDPPSVELRLPGPARQGPDQTFTGTLRVRCAVGDEVSSIHLSFTQGTTATTQEVESLPACTGAWESVGYTSGRGYEAARPATVGAEVVVAEGSVSRSRELWVRPAAKVRFPDKVRLLDNGEVRARVWIRCDEPWGNFATLAWLQQREVEPFAPVLPDVTCDGDFHLRRAVLRADAGEYEPGWAQLHLDITLWDDDFGPYVSANRRVWVKRA